METQSHLNSSCVTIINKTSQHLTITLQTLLGFAVTVQPGTGDIPTINQSKPTGLNITTSQPATSGKNQ